MEVSRQLSCSGRFILPQESISKYPPDRRHRRPQSRCGRFGGNYRPPAEKQITVPLFFTL